MKTKNEALLESYATLNERIKELTAQKEELKDQVALLKEGKYGDMMLVKPSVSRESFKLKDAKAELSEAVLAKIKKYISQVEYQEVRVTRIKKEEEVA